MGDNIKVVIRARPLNDRERPYGSGWQCDDKSVILFDPKANQLFPGVSFTFGARCPFPLPRPCPRLPRPQGFWQTLDR